MKLSRTEEYCDCGALQRAAEDDATPVEFDKKLNEFHLVYGLERSGKMMMPHCFFCGGKAPESLRASLFTRPSREELNRLIELTRPLKTLQETLAALGEPESDREASTIITQPEKDGLPEEARAYRTLTYDGLSDTVRVKAGVNGMEQVAFVFCGKLIDEAAEAPGD